MVWFLATVAAAVSANAQPGGEEAANPFASADDVAAGGRIYRSHCAVCHGLAGEGGRGVALTTGVFRHGSSDTELHETISAGLPGTEMPGSFYNGRQLWQIVAFVKSLSQRRSAERASGDPAKGQEAYAAAGCGTCHRIQGSGGRMGPDLSEIGSVRSLAYLRASILRPDEAVLPRHWMVRAKTRAGEEVSGRRLNEDTHSVQLIDSKGQLRSLRKRNLAELEVDASSAMPAYEGRLGIAEVDDLVAYLASLRRRAENDETP